MTSNVHENLESTELTIQYRSGRIQTITSAVNIPDHVVQRMMMPRAALSTFSSPPPLGYIHCMKLCMYVYYV